MSSFIVRRLKYNNKWKEKSSSLRGWGYSHQNRILWKLEGQISIEGISLSRLFDNLRPLNSYQPAASLDNWQLSRGNIATWHATRSDANEKIQLTEKLARIVGIMWSILGQMLSSWDENNLTLSICLPGPSWDLSYVRYSICRHWWRWSLLTQTDPCWSDWQ